MFDGKRTPETLVKALKQCYLIVMTYDFYGNIESAVLGENGQTKITYRERFYSADLTGDLIFRYEKSSESFDLPMSAKL
jgi:hypothetical protein